MKLYLQYDSEGDTRYLDKNGNQEAGFITSAIPSATINYELPIQPSTVIKDGTMRLHMLFTTVGKVRITPFVILNGPVEQEDGTFETEETIISDSGTDSKQTTLNQNNVTFDWNFVNNEGHSLEDSNLILRLIVEDTRAIVGNPSTIALDDSCHLNVTLGDGGNETIDVYSSIKFKLYQIRERIFAYTRVEAKESIEIPVYTTVTNKEDVAIDAYSRVNVYEDVEEFYRLSATIAPEFDEATDPYLTEVELGDYELPTWPLTGNIFQPGDTFPYFYLRKNQKLYNILEDMSEYPEIMIPPELPTFSEPSNALENVAEKMFETMEMIAVQDSLEVPGDPYRVFSPGPLYPGTMMYASGQWQLPIGYTNQDYSVQFSLNPLKVSPHNKNNDVTIKLTSSLWFIIRHRPVGASLEAYFDNVAGQLVLKKNVTSTEEIRVWMWKNATGPFQIDLFAQNQYLQRPGFAGVSAAMMIA